MPVPDTASWWRVAGMCGQAISPVYRGIQGILMEDIDRVAEVLSQVGYDCDDDVHEGRCSVSCYFIAMPTALLIKISRRNLQ